MGQQWPMAAFLLSSSGEMKSCVLFLLPSPFLLLPQPTDPLPHAHPVAGEQVFAPVDGIGFGEQDDGRAHVEAAEFLALLQHDVVAGVMPAADLAARRRGDLAGPDGLDAADED